MTTDNLPKLEPCPRCDQACLSLYTVPKHCAVQCEECGFTPVGGDHQESTFAAIAAWNAYAICQRMANKR